jgi:hypothetical protein
MSQHEKVDKEKHEIKTAVVRRTKPDGTRTWQWWRQGIAGRRRWTPRYRGDGGSTGEGVGGSGIRKSTLGFRHDGSEAVLEGGGG